MRKKLLLFLSIVLPMVASADSVLINGIYYNLISKGQIAEVTGSGISYDENAYIGDIVIPENVTYENVEYSVTSIGERAFEGATKLTSVIIPNSVTKIGLKAFEGCTNLTSVTLSDNVTIIDGEAFDGCTGLTSINIPNSVTYIGAWAFNSCTGLTSVNIPESVTEIAPSAFSNCSGLTSVTISNNITQLPNKLFLGCTGLTSVTIPNSVTLIGTNVFKGCTGLTSITIPSSVEVINPQAFYGCSGLTSVIIGSGIKTIYGEVFAKCEKLEEVYCYAEEVPAMGIIGVFADSYPEYMTLYVPASSINAYKTDDQWKVFGTIKAIGEGESQKCATPSISYSNNKLSFSCDTEGVKYVSEIKVADGKKYYDSSISLDATYIISVYATKSGYEDSEIATATLVWTSATFEETDTPSAVKSINYNIPALISVRGNTITVSSEADGTLVSVYNINGVQEGSGTISNGKANINTNLTSGSIAIVKIGQKSFKVVLNDFTAVRG